MGSQITRVLTRNERQRVGRRNFQRANRSELKSLVQMMGVGMSMLIVFSLGFMHPHEHEHPIHTITTISLIICILSNLLSPLLLFIILCALFILHNTLMPAFSLLYQTTATSIIYLLSWFLFNFFGGLAPNKFKPVCWMVLYQLVEKIGMRYGDYIKEARIETMALGKQVEHGVGLRVLFSIIILMCGLLIALGFRHAANYRSRALSLSEQANIIRLNFMNFAQILNFLMLSTIIFSLSIISTLIQQDNPSYRNFETFSFFVLIIMLLVFSYTQQLSNQNSLKILTLVFLSISLPLSLNNCPIWGSISMALTNILITLMVCNLVELAIPQERVNFYIIFLIALFRVSEKFKSEFYELKMILLGITWAMMLIHMFMERRKRGNSKQKDFTEYESVREGEI